MIFLVKCRVCNKNLFFVNFHKCDSSFIYRCGVCGFESDGVSMVDYEDFLNHSRKCYDLENWKKKRNSIERRM